ncbi:MAG TPA: MG2 domain-containing protein, partial [Armatimonadota bacterium]
MRSPTGFTRLGLLAALLLAVAIMAAVPLLPLRAQQERYDSLRAEAEKRFQEGSFALSRDLYLEAGKLQLNEDARRWVDFRLADTLWRSQAATQTSDQSNYEAARKQLDLLVRDIQRVEDRDRVWAEVEESLADSYWLPRESRNWGAAWEHYQKALEWWAGSKDLDLARARYLAILFRVAEPPLAQGDYYYYGYYGNMIPLDLLQNGLKIAREPRDLAHLHYLVAMTLRRQGGSVNDQQRIPEEFEASLKAGKQSGWYDDALYQYGEFMASSGPVRLLANGEIRQEPDYVKALALFQRLLREFEKGETRYYDQAKAQVDQITNASVGVSVSNLFTPGTEVQYQINWRNTKRVDLSLYAVELARDTDLSGKDVGAYQWLQHVSIAGKPKTDSWTYATGDLGVHRPGARNLSLKKKLAPGAYVLVATAGAATARDLLLVTDVAVVLKSSNKQALAYVGSALDGAPVAKATVRLWQRFYDEGNWKWRAASQQTNEQGITVFPLVPSQSSTELFAASVAGDRQAFSLGNSYWGFRPPGKEWRIYAYTDRPAYRPNEKAQWKIVARRYDGAVYSTPNREDLEYEIRDPRGAEVRKGKLTLNAFGSAWGDLDLTEAMPLGQYQITFWDAGRHNTIGSATLLRLEEYKLPEFKVSVSTPEVKGRRKTYRLGEEVQVTVQADYYFGGPVANATVEAVVTQSPYYRLWHPTRAYPWYFSDIDNASRMYYGEGQIVKRETLKTDAEGKATLSFPTQQGGQQDLQFRVEARVTDASRREILGSDTVKVTRQRYFVYPRPAHNLYKPGDKVTVNLKAEDANEQPVEVEGTVKVTRDHWWEIWRNPEGREVKGDELHRLKERLPIFPPRPPKPPRRGWALVFRGYKHEDILTTRVRTRSNGEAQVTFTAAKEGYYRVAWTSRDDSLTGQDKPARPVPTPISPIIQAEASVWACSGTTTDLGYRSGGLEIVVDKDTLEAGKDASILV